MSDPDSTTEVLRSTYTFYRPETLTVSTGDNPYPLVYTSDLIDDETGYHLCFGSKLGGAFQNELRGNAFLWIWVVFSCVFWIGAAITDKDNPEIETDQFDEDYWSCWSLYSLYHLGNPYFFNKFIRLVLFYTTVTFLAFFVACMGQLRIYDLREGTIFWYGLVAVLLTFPPTYLLGVMISYINELRIKYFTEKEKMKGKLVLVTGEDVAIDNYVAQLEDALFFW